MLGVGVTRVEFPSDGHTLRGEVRVPVDRPAGAARAAVIVLHGFGGTSEGRDATTTAEYLNELGYATMRFDFRGWS